ncbi:GSCOCG00002593001-RA-CDS [Cotesia congregata]|uniref:Similar to DNAJB9: DnaJ homolog subfamily B member 9 (Cricetulus griseus) n=1 Tax=Cotesia congregata TaxID=51543 RepID=A0A8J2HKU9_COTCN|nr:GSCOCG00002593001-RA-CDS [Cotesia congregata]CAG5101690.1 Similar to DNAJB9: DnaJ homolog subfamily B member 9 (Cricetulus griseus) [Cotesia congregata]
MQKFINHGQIVRISLDQTKRYCSKSTATYYEILGIPKDASKKDVKEAFIKLSKKIHPDKSSETSAKSHNDFVKINEAYRVLSKDHSRQQYDSHLKYNQGQGPPNYRAYNPQGDDPYSRSNAYYRSNSFYQDAWRIRYQQQRRASPNDKNFTPSKIVIYCFLISLVGSLLQLWAVIKSPIFNREEMNRRSERYFNDYRRVREQVVNNNTKILNDLLSNSEFDSDSDDNNNDNYNNDDKDEIKW